MNQSELAHSLLQQLLRQVPCPTGWHIAIVQYGNFIVLKYMDQNWCNRCLAHICSAAPTDLIVSAGNLERADSLWQMVARMSQPESLVIIDQTAKLGNAPLRGWHKFRLHNPASITDASRIVMKLLRRDG